MIGWGNAWVGDAEMEQLRMGIVELARDMACEPAQARFRCANQAVLNGQNAAISLLQLLPERRRHGQAINNEYVRCCTLGGCTVRGLGGNIDWCAERKNSCPRPVNLAQR